MLTKEELAEIARRNGRKSRGPKTAEGKARSAKNNLKNGAYSEVYPHFVLSHSAVLCNEDRQSFFRILENYVDEYKPASPVTLGFVRGMAEDQWRLDRLDALETALFTSEIHRKADTFVPIFLELGDVLETLGAAEAIAARPAVSNLIRRLRREYRASRRDNFNRLVDHRKHFPPTAEHPQSIELERFWASQAGARESLPQAMHPAASQTEGQTEGQTKGQTKGRTGSRTEGRTQPPLGPIAA